MPTYKLKETNDAYESLKKVGKSQQYQLNDLAFVALSELGKTGFTCAGINQFFQDHIPSLKCVSAF